MSARSERRTATMPITYTVDRERRVVFTRWEGAVNARDLADFWRAFLADPVVLEAGRSVVDVRGATFEFTGAELGQLVTTVLRPLLGERTWTTAIVVAGEAQFGVSRQYQSFAESYSRDAIFSEPEAALEWLLRQ